MLERMVIHRTAENESTTKLRMLPIKHSVLNHDQAVSPQHVAKASSRVRLLQKFKAMKTRQATAHIAA